MPQEKKKPAAAGRTRKPREVKPKIETPKPEKTTNSAKGWGIARTMKVSKPLMKGDDVKALQNALIAHNYHCGVDGASGVFERNTAYAIRCFQAANRLVVDGIAGRYTIVALGGVWKG